MQPSINDIALYYYMYMYAVINIIVAFGDDNNIMCNLN